MSNNSSSRGVQECQISNAGAFPILFAIITLPLIIALVKVLLQDLRLCLPRHVILLSLSLSDAILVCMVFVLDIVKKTLTMHLKSRSCIVFRGFFIFFACSTTVVSSLSIVALSVERYIACIHSFQLYRILTEARLRYFTIAIWTFGGLVGIVSISANQYNHVFMVSRSSLAEYIYFITTIPTLIAIVIIQTRLFLFSMEKLHQVIPLGSFGVEAELVQCRKRKFKVTLMAGMVALAYLVCMLPIGVMVLYEILSGDSAPLQTRNICYGISICNNFANTFIYGLGIADTRRIIIRDLRRLKNFLIDILPENKRQRSPQANILPRNLDCNINEISQVNVKEAAVETVM